MQGSLGVVGRATAVFYRRAMFVADIEVEPDFSSGKECSFDISFVRCSARIVRSDHPSIGFDHSADENKVNLLAEADFIRGITAPRFVMVFNVFGHDLIGQKPMLNGGGLEHEEGASGLRHLPFVADTCAGDGR